MKGRLKGYTFSSNRAPTLRQMLGAGSLFFCLICASMPASGASIGLDLTIFLEQPVAGPQPAQDEKLWESACAKLRAQLENRSATIGHGPFAAVSCQKTIERKEIVLERLRSTWALRIRGGGDATLFEIFYLGGSSPSLQARLTTGGTDKLLRLLNDNAAILPITLALADQLPMLSIVRIPAGASEMSTENAVLPKSLPERFMLYQLTYDNERNLMRARPVGTAHTPSKEGRRITWRLHLHQGQVNPGEILFVHNAAGRGENSEGVQDVLSDLLSRYGLSVTNLLTGLLASLDSNLTGARYGFPLTKAGDLIGQSAMFSLFTEIRGGPLAGLRGYFDTAPRVDGFSSTGENTYFDWSRTDLSWAFRLPLPGFVSPLFDSLDLDPKIGVYNLNARFEITDADGQQKLADFNIKRALDVGIEGGLEHGFEDFLVRLWAGYNYSAAIVMQMKTSLSSMRGGIDTYLPLTHFGKTTTLKLLVFSSGEVLTLGQKAQQGNSETKAVTVISSVSYRLLFFGIGGTLAW